MRVAPRKLRPNEILDHGEGIRRTTVIVEADGGIKKVFENVIPQGHSEEVLTDL